MPDCGCFHDFTLNPIGPSRYEVKFDLQGEVDFPRTFRESGVANRIQKHSHRPIYRLQDVADLAMLEKLCESLKSKVIVDLTPGLDFCYAVGPYTVFEEDDSSGRSGIGTLVNSAKYRRDQSAFAKLGESLLTFIQDHPILSRVTAISAPPKSQSDLPDLPGLWAKRIAGHLQLSLIQAKKTRATSPQKNYDGDESESEVVARIKDSISVLNIEAGSKVLILDDTIRSGGTLIELARALRIAGAARIYGLAAAKDGKFTFGGIDLFRGAWQ